MALRLADLARHSIVYGAGAVIVAGAGFLLLPVYTHYLTTSEFGALEILNRLSDIVLVFMFMGMRQAFIRIYYEREDVEWRATVTSTFQWFCLASSVTILVVLGPWAGSAFAKFYNIPELEELVLLALLVAVATMFSRNVLTYFLVQTRSAAYTWTSIVHVVLFSVLTIYLLIFRSAGVSGALHATLYSAGTIAGIGISYILYRVGLRFSYQVFVEMLKFGIPYVPSAIVGFAMVNADRYFLSTESSLHDVGIYALSYKVAMVGGMLLVEPFLKIWSPFLYQAAGSEDGHHRIADVYRYFTATTVGFSLLISVLGWSVIPLISEESFHEASKFIPVISLASVFYAAQHIADAGILVAKKTVFKPLIFTLGAVTAILLNWWLVPEFGVIGAAIATVSTYFVILCATAVVSHMVYPLPVEYGKLIGILAVGFATFVLAYLVVGETGGASNAALSMLCFIAYPVMLWHFGILTREEKDQILAIIKRVRKRA